MCSTGGMSVINPYVLTELSWTVLEKNCITTLKDRYGLGMPLLPMLNTPFLLWSDMRPNREALIRSISIIVHFGLGPGTLTEKREKSASR